MEITAETLRKIRDDKGMSQTEFAEFLGISTRSLQDYEGKKGIPPAKQELISLKLAAENVVLNKEEETSQEVARFEDLVAKKVLDQLMPILSDLNRKIDLIAETSTSVDIGLERIKERVDDTFKEVIKLK